jgi:Flp pilus assembly pilin Flp
VIVPRAGDACIDRRASYFQTFAGGSRSPEEREFREYLSRQADSGEIRLRELTGEVRDMQKLYEHIALGLTRAMTISLDDLKREEGQGAVEYALVVLGVAAVIAAAVAGFTTQITNFMSAAGTALLGFIP